MYLLQQDPQNLTLITKKSDKITLIIQKNKRYHKSKHMLIIFILISTLTSTSFAQWTTLQHQPISIPGHIYKRQCVQNMQVNGSLIFTPATLGTKIDMMVFNGWENLLDGLYFRKYSFEGTGGDFSFVSEITGDCYIKLEVLELGCELLTYFLETYIQTLSQNTSYQSNQQKIYNKPEYLNKIAISIQNPLISQKLTIKYQIQPPISAFLLAINPKSNLLINILNNEPTCLPASNIWYFIINDINSKPTQLIQTNFTLYFGTDVGGCVDYCPDGFLWYDDIANCVPTNPTHSISLIVVCLIATGIAIIFVVSILLYNFLRRRRRDKKQNKNVILNTQVFLKTDLDELAACPICLQHNCNIALPCTHSFHQECIVQWLKKNVLCPVCRSSYKEPRVLRATENNITRV